MAKVCPVSSTKGTPRKRLVGNNVSHANNKTKRVFNLNLQQLSFFSDVFGKMIQLKLSVRGGRTIEKLGGLDAYLRRTTFKKTDPLLRPLKRSFDKIDARKAS